MFGPHVRGLAIVHLIPLTHRDNFSRSVGSVRTLVFKRIKAIGLSSMNTTVYCLALSLLCVPLGVTHANELAGTRPVGETGSVRMVWTEDGECRFQAQGQDIPFESDGSLAVEDGRLYRYHGRNNRSLLAVISDDSIVRLRSSSERLVLGCKTVRSQGERRHIWSVRVDSSIDDIPIECNEVRCTTLLPLITASPNQRDAGSCLYMAMTGAAEIALAHSHPELANSHDGDIDLSERFTMNAGDTHSSEIANWRTDSFLVFNHARGALLNRDYRFRMGWYLDDDSDGSNSSGYPKPATADTPDAQYGCYYNWISELGPEHSNKLVKLPTFDRRVLFEPDNSDIWSTGHYNDDTVATIKTQLRVHRRPVLAIYNHFGYWHAVLIVGYDEERPVDSSFIERFCEKMLEKADNYEAEGTEASLARAKRYRGYVAAVRTNQVEAGSETGGCFFVRDSIYEDADAVLYDYDLDGEGDETPYARCVIERSMSWLKHLTNHLVLLDFPGEVTSR